MIQALIKLIEKWACHHEWLKIGETIKWSAAKDFLKIPQTPSRITYNCRKCGRFKKIRL